MQRTERGNDDLIFCCKGSAPRDQCLVWREEGRERRAEAEGLEEIRWAEFWAVGDGVATATRSPTKRLTLTD